MKQKFASKGAASRPRQALIGSGAVQLETGPSAIRWLWLALCLCLCAGIWYFSSRNGSQSQMQSDRVLDFLSLSDAGMHSFLVRKAAHFLIYCLLGACWTLYFEACGLPVRTSLLLALLMAAGYALIDELHQHFVPGRSGELRDAVLDSLGALTGSACIGLCLQRLRKKSP